MALALLESVLGGDMCVPSVDDMLDVGDAVCCGIMVALREGGAPSVTGIIAVEFLLWGALLPPFGGLANRSGSRSDCCWFCKTESAILIESKLCWRAWSTTILGTVFSNCISHYSAWYVFRTSNVPPLLCPCLLGNSDLGLLCVDLLTEGLQGLDRSLFGDGNRLPGLNQLPTILRLLLLLFNIWLFLAFCRVFKNCLLWIIMFTNPLARSVANCLPILSWILARFTSSSKLEFFLAHQPAI